MLAPPIRNRDISTKATKGAAATIPLNVELAHWESPSHSRGSYGSSSSLFSSASAARRIWSCSASVTPSSNICALSLRPSASSSSPRESAACRPVEPGTGSQPSDSGMDSLNQAQESAQQNAGQTLMFVPIRIDLGSAVSQAGQQTVSFCEQKSCAAPRTL